MAEMLPNGSTHPMTNGQVNQEMVELVERVAKAIYDATHNYNNCYAWDDAWEDYQEAYRGRYYKEARAALEAAGIETLLKQQEEMREALIYIAETTDDWRTSSNAFDALASLTKPALEDKSSAQPSAGGISAASRNGGDE